MTSEMQTIFFVGKIIRRFFLKFFFRGAQFDNLTILLKIKNLFRWGKKKIEFSISNRIKILLNKYIFNFDFFGVNFFLKICLEKIWNFKNLTFFEYLKFFEIFEIWKLFNYLPQNIFLKNRTLIPVIFFKNLLDYTSQIIKLYNKKDTSYLFKIFGDKK